MSIAELMPAVVSLPHADKFRLVQLLLEQLAKEEGITLQQSVVKPFNPRLFFGVAQTPKQDIDAYVGSLREGWL